MYRSPLPIAAADGPDTPPDADLTAGGRRSKRRDRTAVACGLIHGRFRERHPGVVRDIHEGGARIRPACSPSVIQDPVELDVNGERIFARIAWRSERELGLSFGPPNDEGTSHAASLRLLAVQMRGGQGSRGRPT